jgi:hypothetical protein
LRAVVGHRHRLLILTTPELPKDCEYSDDGTNRKQVYAPRHRAEWLGKIGEPGVRRRAEFYYQQLDALRCLRQEVRRDLVAESKKH